MKKFFLFLCLIAWCRALPQMAVVIDDCGYSLADVKIYTALEYPLTMAVIPGQAHSRVCAKEIRSANKNLLIHLPWTPLGKNGRKEYPVRIEQGYSTANITSMLKQAFASVPDADGLNNHQGSILSADKMMMNKFMSVYQQYKDEMYFLDSSTTRNSRAERTARRYGILTTHNDIFLDGIQKEEAIEKRFAEAVTIAKRQGTVVAIAHCSRPVTKRVLKKLMTKYNEQVEFVYLPEIIAARTKG